MIKAKGITMQANPKVNPATCPRNVEISFWRRVKKTDGCWLWTGSAKGGYGYIMIRGKLFKVHRYSFELHFGPIPLDRPHVCHRCDTPLCVRPDHLFAGTNNDNRQDSVQKRRHMFGERHWNRKLTEADVLEIRRRGAPHTKGPDSIKQLAIEFGVAHGQISGIYHRKKWKWVA